MADYGIKTFDQNGRELFSSLNPRTFLFCGSIDLKSGNFTVNVPTLTNGEILFFVIPRYQIKALNPNLTPRITNVQIVGNTIKGTVVPNVANEIIVTLYYGRKLQ